MSDTQIWPFRNDDDEFVAVGKQRDDMRVWRIDGPYLKETPLRFPGCTRFMPYAELGEPRIEDWDAYTQRFTLIRLRPTDFPAP